MSRFAHAVREELWLRDRLLESRLQHGQAEDGQDGIIAADVRDDALVASCERELDRLRASAPRGDLVHLVAEAGTGGATSIIIVRRGPLSIVTTAEHVEEDMSLLRRAGITPATQAPDTNVPLLWLNGSAAVLLHESHGHALEHGRAPLRLPEWLHADVPLRRRRASFRDVPLLRMGHVHVSQRDAPFALPTEHVAVHLVEGGSYEPLTDTVTLRIAHATYRGATIAPFELSTRRHAIRFVGASGDAVRYPGVICSREGQELLVESWAPAVLTELA